MILYYCIFSNNFSQHSEEAARSIDPKSLYAGGNDFFPMDESAEFMLMDKTRNILKLSNLKMWSLTKLNN